MRLYDVTNDSFLTERPEIIDALVESAASLLTYSERRDKPYTWPRSAEASSLLSAAARDEESKIRFVLTRVVGDLWRARVAP